MTFFCKCFLTIAANPGNLFQNLGNISGHLEFSWDFFAKYFGQNFGIFEADIGSFSGTLGGFWSVSLDIDVKTLGFRNF